jgi:hypothetical protein
VVDEKEASRSEQTLRHVTGTELSLYWICTTSKFSAVELNINMYSSVSKGSI